MGAKYQEKKIILTLFFGLETIILNLRLAVKKLPRGRKFGVGSTLHERLVTGVIHQKYRPIDFGDLNI